MTCPDCGSEMLYSKGFVGFYGWFCDCGCLMPLWYLEQMGTEILERL